MLISEVGITTTGIAKYESEMRKYAGIGIQRSYLGGKKIFAQLPFDKCEVIDM